MEKTKLIDQLIKHLDPPKILVPSIRAKLMKSSEDLLMARLNRYTTNTDLGLPAGAQPVRPEPVTYKPTEQPHRTDNHKHSVENDNRPVARANRSALCDGEDFRRGAYYVRHTHRDLDKAILYLVFKDNPNPTKNWRGNDSLFASMHWGDIIEWIGNRRCFKK